MQTPADKAHKFQIGTDNRAALNAIRADRIHAARLDQDKAFNAYQAAKPGSKEARNAGRRWERAAERLHNLLAGF